jgi:hypothetical protein
MLKRINKKILKNAGKNLNAVPVPHSALLTRVMMTYYLFGGYRIFGGETCGSV